jgi:multidrug efflux pump subunit AcrA (membrane-fusion protein)
MRANTFSLTKPIPALVWLCCALLISTTGCQPKNEYQEPPPPTVTVANPIQKKVIQALEFTGTTSPVNKVDIRARVEGFLESIEFEEGKAVKRGDLLFTIDPRPFEAQLAQANASVKVAQAQVASGMADENRAIAEVANANAQLARSEKAAASGAVTASEIDLLKTAVLTARSGV